MTQSFLGEKESIICSIEFCVRIERKKHRCNVFETYVNHSINKETGMEISFERANYLEGIEINLVSRFTILGKSIEILNVLCSWQYSVTKIISSSQCYNMKKKIKIKIFTKIINYFYHD